MTDTTIAIRDIAPPAYTTEQRQTIRKTLAKDCTPEEFSLFMEVCIASGLNPFQRQIYAVKRGDKMTIQTGIDGYRLMAERSGKYAGQTEPTWCGKDGMWRSVWLDKEPPAAARIGIFRQGFQQPMYAVARYESYAQKSQTWDKMPDVMLAKCAEALALRKAFPAQLSGIYTNEEMQQADAPDASYVEGTVTHITEETPPAQAKPQPKPKPTPQPKATQESELSRTLKAIQENVAELEISPEALKDFRARHDLSKDKLEDMQYLLKLTTPSDEPWEDMHPSEAGAIADLLLTNWAVKHGTSFGFLTAQMAQQGVKGFVAQWQALYTDQLKWMGILFPSAASVA